MGNSESNQVHRHKNHNVPLKLPMPNPEELDERFENVMVSLSQN